MGGCVSLQISCDRTLDQVSGCLCGEASYVYNLKENLESLEEDMERLRRRRVEVQNQVDVEEAGGRQRLETVGGWLLDVEKLEAEVGKLLAGKEAALGKLCLWGYISTHQYGKNVFQKNKKVKEYLEAGGVFTDVTGPALPPPVNEIPTGSIVVGLEPMLNEAWEHLMRDEVGIMGLYGMGGVGKTTLLTHINNKFLEERHGFDKVIWVVVSKDLQIESIQEKIGEKLGLCVGEWKKKELEEKAIDIHKVLKDKKFVLLLDDIWERVKLEKIGVPNPNQFKGRKVVFTTRSRYICGRMGAEPEVEVKILEEDVAWDLFRKTVGERTLNSHPEIPELARKVAGKCHGLPLALSIIGQTMACKRSVEEWRRAVDVLTSAATELSGMDEILPILKFSYDNLKGDKIKSCFLYCALFPEDHKIYKRTLTQLWLGEGIVEGNRDWDSITNEAYEIIGILVHACLLMENGSRDRVKMHDVVREMALWIASDCEKAKENFVVKAGTGLCRMPDDEDWKATTKMSLMYNQIENILNSPECPRLSTLLAKNNRQLKNISGKFFSSMPHLVVLDLSWNDSLKELPEEISKLVSLRYLNLEHSGILRLPVSLKELRKLIFLNLSDTTIRSFHGISCLSNLQVLGLYGCHGSLILDVMEKLQLLEHLILLSITLEGDRVFERFLSLRKLVSVTQGVFLKNLGLPLDETSLATLKGVHDLRILRSDILEIKIDMGREMILPLHNGASPRFPYFRSLSCVSIWFCHTLRDLTWLLFASNLAVLDVTISQQIEEIVSRERVVGPSNSIMPFQKLRSLRLRFLDELKSIYWSPLSFPCLEEVTIIGCPKLKKLPLNSESAKGCHISILAEKEWMEGAEWEDEATKERLFRGLIAIHEAAKERHFQLLNAFPY